MKVGQAIDEFKELVDYAKENLSTLTAWQQEFIIDFGRRVYDFEEECFVSDRQLDQLDKISETLGLDKIDRGMLDD